MISLGSRSFAGPFMAPLWSPPRAAGIYAAMAPGWRLLTFRALDFGEAADFAEPQLLKRHPRYREWLTIVGTEWNLYIATHDLPLSTAVEREATLRALLREYRPEFKPMTAPELPDLRTLLLAQATRTNKES